MTESGCPSRRALCDFCSGALPSELADEVAEHVETCALCESTLGELEEGGIALLAPLRKPVAETGILAEPQLEYARGRVEAMLHRIGTAPAHPSGAHSAADTSIAAGCSDTTADAAEQLRDYRLLAVIGQGAMGTVYRALHTRLDKIVALKVLPEHRTRDEKTVARFDREMKAVGKLQHPHIVAAHDAGEAEGRHFLVMEYVDGLNLAELVRRVGPLRIADACELVRQAALGLEYVYQHALVHRDIKPSNLMLSVDGQLKILDLGLALIQYPQGAAGDLTGSMQLMGTADYIAPEQVTDSHLVDIRADIYSLGCTLYKLLSGKAPFTGPSFHSVMAKVVAHLQTPIRPIREHRPDVSQELASVLERLLAKSPSDRFATPAEVASTLAPFAVGNDLAKLAAEAIGQQVREAISPITALEVNPAPTLAIEDVQASGTVAAVRGLPPPPSRRRVALFAAGFLCLAAVVVIVRNREGQVVGRLEVRDGHSVEVRADNNATPTSKVDDGTGRAAPPSAKPAPNLIEAEPLEIKDGAAMSPAALIANPAAIARLKSWTIETRGHRSVVEAIAFAPNGREMLSGGRDGTIRIWQASTGRLLRILMAASGVTAAAWSPDGRFLATGHGDGVARLWDAPAGQLLRSLRGHHSEVTSLGWSTDGRRLATGSSGGDKAVRLWNVEDGDLLFTLAGHGNTVRQVAFSPDGLRIASTDDDGACRVCDTESGNVVHTVSQRGAIRALAWSPDGNTLAIAAESGVRLWRPTSDAPPDVVDLKQQGVTSLRWLSDDKTLASVAGDGNAIFWNTAESRALRTFRVEKTGGGNFRALAWAPDGKQIGTVADDGTGTLQVVDTRSGKQWLIPGHDVDIPLWNYSAPPVAWSPRGNLLAYGSPTSDVTLWDASTGEVRNNLKGHFGPLVSLAWAPVGGMLASGGSNNEVRLWDSAGGKLLQVITDGGWMSGLAWSPDAEQVATGGPGGTLNIWKVADATRVGKLAGHKGPVVMAWSPNGKQLLSGSYDGTVRLWDVEARQALKTFDSDQNEQKFGEIHSVAWSHDGKQFAAGGAGAIWLWDAESQQMLPAIKSLPGWVYSLSWSPDGGSLAAGCGANALVWDAATRELRHTLSGRVGLVPGVSWSSDSRFLATSTLGTRGIQIWDVAAEQVHSTLLPLSGGHGLALTPTGHFHSSPANTEEIVYVVQTDKGQETLKPNEFVDRFGWKNDPEQVRIRE